jgi:hypothetical protein
MDLSHSSNLSCPLVTFFIHEIGQVLRGRGMGWWRAAYVAVSGAIFVPMIFSRGNGQEAFRALMLWNAVVAFILVLGQFSKAVSGHREAGTLELLRITTLSPFTLLLGTGTSLYLRTLLLFLAQLPFAAFCVPLGEISRGAILGAYVLAAAVLFFLCHAGLYWSVVKSSQQAGSRTVMTASFLYFSPFLITLIGRPSFLNFPSWMIEPTAWLGDQNPLSALTVLVSGGHWPIASILLHFALGGIFLGAAVWRFESSCERQEDAQTVETRTGLTKTQRDPTEKARLRLVSRVEGHPIAWKEFHFAAGGTPALRFRWFSYLALATFIVFASRSIWLGVLLAGAGGLLLELPLAMTKIIGAEVQQRTLGDLAVLPMHPWRIVFEKIRGHLPMLVPAVLVTFAGILLSNTPWKKLISTPAFWLILVYVVWQVAFLFIITLYLSLTRPIQAYAMSFAFVILANAAVLGLLAHFLPKSFPFILLLPMALSGWLGYILIRIFPATFYQTAAK